ACAPGCHAGVGRRAADDEVDGLQLVVHDVAVGRAVLNRRTVAVVPDGRVVAADQPPTVIAAVVGESNRLQRDETDTGGARDGADGSRTVQLRRCAGCARPAVLTHFVNSFVLCGSEASAWMSGRH